MRKYLLLVALAAVLLFTVTHCHFPPVMLLGAAATKFTNKLIAMYTDRVRTSATYTTEPKWIGIGTGGTTAAVTDTALGTEVETRAVGTSSLVTTTVTGDTYQTLGTVSITGTRAITECASFDALTTGNIGISATIATINLLSGDSLQLTCKAQLTSS